MFIVLLLRTVAHPNFIRMHRCAVQVILVFVSNCFQWVHEFPYLTGIIARVCAEKVVLLFPDVCLWERRRTQGILVA